MAKVEYGLNIHAHGSTSHDTLCFIPPIFTNVIMAENYGKPVVNFACKYNTIGAYAMLNNPSLNFIGRRLYIDIDGRIKSDYLTHMISGIFMCFDIPSYKYYKLLNLETYLNLFKMNLTSGNEELMDYLSKIKMVYNFDVNDYEIHIPKIIDGKVTDEYILMPNYELEYFNFELNNLDPEDFKIETIKKNSALAAINNIIKFKNLLKIPLKDNQIYKDCQNLVYSLCNADIIIYYSNLLLLGKSIIGNIPMQKNGTHQNILSIISENNYKNTLSNILASLKCELIESRLKHKLATPFALRCIACRGIESQAKRIQPYQNIVSQPQYANILNPTKKVAKSTTKYTDGNTANSVNDMEKIGFEGFLKPSIVIHETLYPLFLYVINPKSIVFDKNISSDVMNNLINGLAKYEINKSKIIIVLYQISSQIISDVIEELYSKFGQEKSPNRAMFEAAFNNLITMYSYTVEDIIITFGPIIKHFNDYMQINQGVFRTFSNLDSDEYPPNTPKSPANNTKKQNNSGKAKDSKSRVKSHKKLKSAKQAKPSYSDILMGNQGLAINILSQKANYLSSMVSGDKAKYLPILFDMVEIA